MCAPLEKITMDTNLLLNNDIIKKSQLFKQLNDEQICELLQHAEPHTIERNQYLLHQGDEPSALVFILAGELFTFRSTFDGNEIIIRMLTAGETCVDVILFPIVPSPVSIKAMKDTQVLCFDAFFLYEFMKQHPQLSTNLIYIVSKYYRRAMLQIDNFTLRDATYRVGRYLLNLSNHSENNLDFNLSFRKADIANYLGMTPETLSRSLKELQTMGVKIDKLHVILENPDALSQFCDSKSFSRCICNTKSN